MVTRTFYPGVVNLRRGVFPRLFLVGLALSNGGTQAQTVPNLPNAGRLLQEIMPSVEFIRPKISSPLRLQAAPEVPLPETSPFVLRQIRITGNTVFDTPTLHALVAHVEGQKLTLPQLSDAIYAITEFYRKSGYPLARAIIPVQTIDQGSVTVQVIEAHIGEVELNNHSIVNTDFLRDTLAGVQPGLVIQQFTIEDVLQLLLDVPGILPAVVMRPGQAVGTSDLVLDVQPGAGFNADATLDSYGGRYTGRQRMAANLQWYNPVRRGDTLGLSALSSGSGLGYGRVSYEIPLTGRGPTLGAALSSLKYALGDTAQNLNAHGSAQQNSVWLRNYLARSTSRQVTARLQFDSSTLRDDVDSTGVLTDRQIKVLGLDLQAQGVDAWGGGGSSSASLGFHTGSVSFDNDAAQSADASSAQTQGNFSLLNMGLERNQTLGSQTSLWVSFNGQWARNNLDTSQKFSLGGARSVRAYEPGVLSGDSGQLVSVELRQNLPLDGLTAGQWRAVLFADAGGVQINRSPWSGGDNQASISGVGVGLDWRGASRWNARLYIARSMGAQPSQLAGSDSAHGSAWLEISKGF